MSSAEETSIFHIVSRRGLKIVINPILVHVVQSIMPNVYSPEVWQLLCDIYAV